MSQPAWPTRHETEERTTRLTWVHPSDEFGEFKPFVPPRAETPEGFYSIARCGYRFDAWFCSREGEWVFLGTSRTIQMAMKQCEHREARRHAPPQAR